MNADATMRTIEKNHDRPAMDACYGVFPMNDVFEFICVYRRPSAAKNGFELTFK
jgi:hypothetical protein